MQYPSRLFSLPVYVCWCGDFVKIMVGVSVSVAVFLFLLRVFLLLFPLAELQCGVFPCVYPHLKKRKRRHSVEGVNATEITSIESY